MPKYVVMYDLTKLAGFGDKGQQRFQKATFLNIF